MPPRLQIIDRLDHEYFIVGGTISFCIDMDIEGAFSINGCGIEIAVNGSAITEGIIDLNGKDALWEQL